MRLDDKLLNLFPFLPLSFSTLLLLDKRVGASPSVLGSDFPLPIFGMRTGLYHTITKPEKRNHWGSNFLPSILKGGKAKKSSPGQMSLPWDKQRVTESTEVHEVAEKFIHANCYQPPVPGIGFA